VIALREVKVAGQGSGVGAVAGGVVGGVLGHQVGEGRGKDVARVLGAIGGAVAGHQIEKQARASVRHEIDVRMEDGSLRTITSDAPLDLRTGDAVRVDNGRLLRADGQPVAQRPQPASAPASTGTM
jgi:outer membrane lipoprotein SlyB